jgi:hypothetical protein
MRRRCYLRKYGLTRSGVEALRGQRGNRCALCGGPDPGHVDHEHASGRVRALLCERCNLGLGQFKDDPDVLRAAADYVERHREPQAGERAEPPSREAVLAALAARPSRFEAALERHLASA